MPELLAPAIATPGLVWLLLAAFAAGVVRGFSGFGTAMIFLPVAGQVLPPLEAVTVLIVMDFFGPLPNLPRAWRDGAPGDVVRLLVGCAVLLPVGLALLLTVDPAIFRYVVSAIALVLLACLVLGLRYRGRVNPPMVYGIGGAAGFLGGVAGIPGPPVILFYMASPLPSSAIRANNMMFLFGFDILMISILLAKGELALAPALIGLLCVGPIVAGNVLGAVIYKPEYERLYRAVAYVVIAVSAIRGLPIWS